MSDSIELYPLDRPTRLATFSDHVCDFTGVTAQGEAVQVWVPIEPPTSAFVVRKKPPAFVKVSVASPSISWVRDLPGAQISVPAEILADQTILTRVFREDRLDVRASYRDGSIRTEFH